MVVDDHAAVAVENSAARRQDRHGLNPVGFRTFAVELRILHLKLPKSGYQKQEKPHGDVLEDRYLPRGKMRVVPKCWLFNDLLLFFEIGVNGRKDHNSNLETGSSS